jgi:hypothetical protein
MKNTFFITSLCFTILLLAGLFTSAHAATKFMDDRLVISGFIKETAYIRTAMYDREKRFHDSNLDFLTTAALFEALYTAREDDDLTIRLFGGLKGWWEKSHYFDHDYNRSIPHRSRKDWVKPRSFNDDILSEAYIDIIKDPWQVRIGKQIVIWGQLDLERVADVVNPIDLRRGPPGINTWEELKKGLWMIRTFYQSDLPGNLLFETIFNPGDFQNIDLMYEGAQPGPPAWDVRFFAPEIQKFGIYHWNREKWTRDAPGWNWSNWELGFRVRGFTWGIDWTLLYWNARDDSPVAHPDRLTPFILPFMLSGIRTAITGSWVAPPDWPDHKVFYYKRYQTLGGTAQYFAPDFFDTVWRMEWFYEIGRPLAKGTDGDGGAQYGWTNRDILGIALQGNKKFNIPGFTKSRIASNFMLETSLTYGWEKVFNHDHDLVLSDRNHNRTDSSNDVITFWCMQGLFNMKFVFVFTGNYYLRINKWFAVPTLAYIFPGQHWRADISYAAYGGANREYVKSTASLPSNDQFVIRLRYEF